MPSAAAITVTDGTTPKTFSPNDVGRTSAGYQDLTVTDLQSRGELILDRPSNESTASIRRRQVRLVLKFPYTDSKGVVTIKPITFTGSVVSPVEATPAQRAQVRKYAAAALANADIVAAFDNPEWVW